MKVLVRKCNIEKLEQLTAQYKAGEIDEQEFDDFVGSINIAGWGISKASKELITADGLAVEVEVAI